MDTRKGSPRPNNGGAGRGQGRIGSIKPMRLITMDTYPEAQSQLAAITHYHRKTGQPRVSQPAIVAQLIEAEYARLGLEPDIEVGSGRLSLEEEDQHGRS